MYQQYSPCTTSYEPIQNKANNCVAKTTEKIINNDNNNTINSNNNNKK